MWIVYLVPKHGAMVSVTSMSKPAIKTDSEGRKYIGVEQPEPADETHMRMIWKKNWYLDDLLNWSRPLEKGHEQDAADDEAIIKKDIDEDSEEFLLLEFIIVNDDPKRRVWYTFIKDRIGKEKDELGITASKLGRYLTFLTENGYLSSRKSGMRRIFVPTKAGLEWYDRHS